YPPRKRGESPAGQRAERVDRQMFVPVRRRPGLKLGGEAVDRSLRTEPRKGKPVVRRGRKATGLRRASRATEWKDPGDGREESRRRAKPSRAGPRCTWRGLRGRVGHDRDDNRAPRR